MRKARVKRIVVLGAGLAGSLVAGNANAQALGVSFACHEQQTLETCCASDQGRTEGSSGNDTLTVWFNGCGLGYDGDDSITGTNGRDTLVGGNGNDYLRGGRSHDTLLGGPGNDYVVGDEGDDQIFGHDGDDNLRGYMGDDHIDGGKGYDELRGSYGNDVLIPGPGADYVLGGEGDDTVILKAPCEIANWGVLSGDEGDDTLITPLTVEELEARGYWVGGFERVIIDRSQLCSASCSPANCDEDSATNLGDDNYGFVQDLTWTPEDFDSVCSIPPINGNHPVTGEPYDDTPVITCPPPMKPIMEAGCTWDYTTGPFVNELNPEDRCDIVGFEQRTQAEGGCDYFESLSYCTEVTHTRREQPPGSGVIIATRPSYEKIEGLSYEELLDPPVSISGYCEDVPANNFCCVVDQDCHDSSCPWDCTTEWAKECLAMAGEKGGAEYACPSDDDAGDAYCAANHPDRPQCYNGECRGCFQFTQCADPIAEPDSDADEAGPNFPEETGVAGPDIFPDTERRPTDGSEGKQDLPFGCAGNNCRVSTTPILRGTENQADEDMFTIRGCNWEEQAVVPPGQELAIHQGDRNPIDKVAHDEEEDETTGTSWVRKKGNARFGMVVMAGLEHHAEFASKFADGALFDVGASGYFSLVGRVFGREKEILGIDVGGSVDECGLQASGSARVATETVQITPNGPPLAFEFESSLVDRQTCEQLRDDINEIRKAANDRLHDMQVAVDYWETFGGNPYGNNKFLSETRRNSLKSNYERAVSDYEAAIEDFQAVQSAIAHGFSYEQAIEPVPRRLLGVELAYAMGPFRVGVDIETSIFWGITLGGGIDYKMVESTTGGITVPNPKVGVNAIFAPGIGADVQAAFFAGLGNRFIGAEAGIIATLNLITVELPITAGMEVERKITMARPATGRFLAARRSAQWDYDWNFGAGVTIKSLAGLVELFVRARVFGIKKTWKKALASWSGIEHTFNLFSGGTQGSNGINEPLSAGDVGNASDQFLGRTPTSPSFPALTFEGVGEDPTQWKDLSDYEDEWQEDVRLAMENLGKNYLQGVNSDNVPNDPRCRDYVPVE